MLNLRACLTRVASRTSICCADPAAACAAQAYASHSLSAHGIAASWQGCLQNLHSTQTAMPSGTFQKPTSMHLTTIRVSSDHTATHHDLPHSHLYHHRIHLSLPPISWLLCCCPPTLLYPATPSSACCRGPCPPPSGCTGCTPLWCLEGVTSLACSATPQGSS